MATPFDHYPYTNFHELNLAYFIVHFREIFAQWDELYSDMLEWKDATDAELADWKTGVLSDIDAWETALNTSLEGWKADTESDITGWMNEVIDALDAWKEAFETLFNTTFSNLEDIKTDAEAARDAAIAAQTAAEVAAASVTASAAQIAINTSDIADLKAQLDELADATAVETETETDITNTLTKDLDGYYQTNVGNTKTAREGTATEVYKMTLTEGDIVTVKGYNYYTGRLLFTEAGGVVTSVYPDTTETQQYYEITYTATENCTAYFLKNLTYANSFSVSIPSVSYEQKKFTVEIQDTDFIELVDTVNIYDPADAVEGYRWLTNGTKYQDPNTFYCMIPVEEGNYTYLANNNYFGANYLKVMLFGDNETYIKTATATSTESTGARIPATIAISAQDINDGVKYMSYQQSIAVRYDTMVVKGDSYPETFVKYHDPYYALDGVKVEIDDVIGIDEKDINPLYGKIAIFDGDSICNGDSALDDTRGWASRIGTANEMIWHNYAVSGGTIAYIPNDPPLHCISRYIDQIYVYYPTLDYLILEGGTNDADRLRTDPTKWGEIDETDFSGNYDDTTFCGAIETLFYKAINYYPSAKIGYIVAQKMGQNPAGYGDDNNRYKFFTMAMQACKKWGIFCVNLWDESHLNPMLSVMYDNTKTPQENIDAGKFYVDGQHLTSNGYEVITPIIEAWMKTM